MSMRILRTCLNHVKNQRHFHLQASCRAPIVVPMPALSPTMEEGGIVKWHVKEGDTVEPGDPICEVETDKAVVTVEATDDGTIAKILVPEGSKNVKLSVPIAIIAEDGEDVAEAAKFVPVDPTLSSASSSPPAAAAAPPAAASTPPPPPPPAAAPAQSASAIDFSSSVAPISPAVRHALEWHNINPSQVSGTGKKGRILKGDVLSYININNLQPQAQVAKSGISQSSQPPPPPVAPQKKAKKAGKQKAAAAAPQVAAAPAASQHYEDIPLSNIRKVIASRLTQSKKEIPHSYTSISCNVDSVLELRKSLLESGIKLSMNDFVVKAAGEALQEIKVVNSVWEGEDVKQMSGSDISIAVATDKGLITPILKNVESKALQEISSETKSLAGKARDGKLKPEEFQGGSFTISNLGMFGVREFTAVINPPQTCIMAVGTTRKIMTSHCSEDVGAAELLDIDDFDEVDDENAAFCVKNMVTVTMSSDARVVDDHQAGLFLNKFKEKLEVPVKLFV